MEKQRTVKDESYYVISGWMTNPKKMNLKGLELQLYAIIYGFCQSQPLNGYFAKTDYLAEFTGSTSRGVRKALDSLVKKGYLIREAQDKYHTYKYIAIVPDFDEQSENNSSRQNEEQNSAELEKNDKNEELSSANEELSSANEELSSANEELSSTNNIYINNNNISNKPTKKEGSSLCSFADARDVRLTFSELLYLQKYYGQKLATKYIQKLQLYLERNPGKKYKDHRQVIEQWICEDNPLIGAEETNGVQNLH